MLWFEELGWIYVLYNEVYPDGGPGGDLQWERYDDNWIERVVEDMLPLPPPGLFAPVGRFGLLWKENLTVRERLGWALAPETAYDGAWQLQPSDTDNPGDGAIFILLEDGHVARLSGFDIWGWLWTAFETVN
jgi:hypothetical protein